MTLRGGGGGGGGGGGEVPTLRCSTTSGHGRLIVLTCVTSFLYFYQEFSLHEQFCIKDIIILRKRLDSS